MEKLADYGIRIINHGEWSDPEVQWKKSRFQTLLFNYWDCVDCFENDDYDFDNEEDCELFYQNLFELTPSEYDYPQVSYEWTVWTDSGDGFYDETLFDDADYYKVYKLSPKKDFVLHTAGQALKQALSYVFDCGMKNVEISVFRRDDRQRERVAHYIMQGSTLRNQMNYTK